MKTFKEFLEESSLSRIKSKSDKGGMAIISGSRGDKSAKENRARAKQLDRDIKGKGLPGATKVSGHDAIQQAISVMYHCTEMEKDLITALSTRHSAEARDAADPSVLNMGNSPELNVAFAEAMAPLM